MHAHEMIQHFPGVLLQSGITVSTVIILLAKLSSPFFPIPINLHSYVCPGSQLIASIAHSLPKDKRSSVRESAASPSQL